MNLIDTLQKLEPVFIQAGQLALKMQKGVGYHNKLNTGDSGTDIVTEADFSVQELLLQKMSETDLINCRLLAEEKTESAKLFNEKGKHYLSIDPIDDTAIYAKGNKHFSTIISLHDGKKFLYMFVYFPAWEWTHKMVNSRCSVSGKTPDLPSSIQDTVVFWSGNPQQNIPKDVLDKLNEKGIKFVLVRDVNLDVGSIGMFASGKVAGVYQEDPNTYDGLVEMNIALSKGLEVHSSNFDLADIKTREQGLYYSGWYLALNIPLD